MANLSLDPPGISEHMDLVNFSQDNCLLCFHVQLLGDSALQWAGTGVSTWNTQVQHSKPCLRQAYLLSRKGLYWA